MSHYNMKSASGSGVSSSSSSGGINGTKGKASRDSGPRHCASSDQPGVTLSRVIRRRSFSSSAAADAAAAGAGTVAGLGDDAASAAVPHVLSELRLESCKQRLSLDIDRKACVAYVQ